MQEFKVVGGMFVAGLQSEISVAEFVYFNMEFSKAVGETG